MCHQSVGLIARHLEEGGVPTVSLSSALSITSATNPPRATFLDYPLGHTAGRPGAIGEQMEIVHASLALLESTTESGTIVALPHSWPTPWKNRASHRGDERTLRLDTPQYERPGDEAAVDATL